MNIKKNKLRMILLLGFTSLLLFTVSGDALEKIPSLSRKDMDLSVKPGDDFFRYVNGAWIERTKIPDDKVSYTSFDIVREHRDAAVHSLLESAAVNKTALPGSIEQKVGDFYATGMDVKKIEEQGITPLKEEFSRIDKIATITDLQDVIAHLHTYGLGILFGESVFLDLKNSKIQKFYLMQSGLGLPDRDYYTKNDDRSKEIRLEYVNHIAKMFMLLGESQEKADLNAKTVMNIETQLAHKSKTRLELRNFPALYNKMTMDELQNLAPSIDWRRFLHKISDIDFGDVVVGMPKFFKEISVLMKEVPIDQWKTYLRWHLLNDCASYLSSDFVNQDYRFNQEFLSGSKRIEERWQRVVKTTNAALGMLVGQLYVKKYFPPESKNRMVELVDNLKKALEIHIKKLDWMSDETKKHALAKLHKMRVRIGYPDKWEDSSELEIKRDSYMLNVLRAYKYRFYKNLEEFTKPVDPDKWTISPQVVNAGYNPVANAITFPAAILQPPFFMPDGDDAINYGAIGMGIGHEMTHGFDDQGRKFDQDGNIKDWWTKEDAEKFKKRAQLLVEQYNNFVAIDNVHVNGELTLGENIADFGGLTIAFTAYKLSLEGKEKPKPIDGFTDEQRFFLAFAKLWQGKIRDKALKRKVQEDVHPWGEFRANGAPFNMPEFYRVFDIKPGDRLYRSEKQRPVIW